MFEGEQLPLALCQLSMRIFSFRSNFYAAVSASQHRSRNSGVTLTYKDASGERQRSPSTRFLRTATIPRPVLGVDHAQEPGSDDGEGGDRPEEV